MRRFLSVFAIALGALVFAPTHEVWADDPPAATTRFAGNYACSNLEAATAGIETAIEDVVSEMGFIKRPFARSKLKSTNPALGTVQFQFSGNQLTYTYGGSKVIRSTLGAPAVRWQSPEDGENYQVSTQLTGNRILQIIRGADGVKQEAFDFSPDGSTITYHVVVSSPKLPKPLRYSYSFKRK